MALKKPSQAAKAADLHDLAEIEQKADALADELANKPYGSTAKVGPVAKQAVASVKAPAKQLQGVGKPLQVRTNIDKHSEIKAFAAACNMSITDLMLEAYEEYRARRKG
mgnify:FL=1